MQSTLAAVLIILCAPLAASDRVAAIDRDITLHGEVSHHQQGSADLFAELFFFAAPRNADISWERRANLSVHGYMEAARFLHTKLTDMHFEWWLADGNQLATYRYGTNFGMLDAGLHAVDTDLDVMIKVDSPQAWETVAENIKGQLLKSPMFASCHSAPGPLLKFTCQGSTEWKSSHRMDGCLADLKADVMGYVVNHTTDVAVVQAQCMQEPSRCSQSWPFQLWGGSAPYHGLIVNANGQLGEGIYGQDVVPVPHNFIEMATKWDNHEYGMTTIQAVMPSEEDACILRRNQDTWTNGVTLSHADRKSICRRAEKLALAGYAAFHCDEGQLLLSLQPKAMMQIVDHPTFPR